MSGLSGKDLLARYMKKPGDEAPSLLPSLVLPSLGELLHSLPQRELPKDLSSAARLFELVMADRADFVKTGGATGGRTFERIPVLLHGGLRRLEGLCEAEREPYVASLLDYLGRTGTSHRNSFVIANLRDTGGLRTEDGRLTRRNTLFRSSNPMEGWQLDSEELFEFQGLGIRAIIDLRWESGSESAHSRYDGHVGIKVHRLPLLTEEIFHKLSATCDSASEIYQRATEVRRCEVCQAIEKIAESGAEPFLVHCAAGVDRTGLVLALALRGAGVTMEDIAHDYTMSGSAWGETFVPAPGATEVHDDELFHRYLKNYARDPQIIIDAVRHVESGTGGLAGYLEGGGLDPAQTLGRLRAKLVADDGVQSEP